MSSDWEPLYDLGGEGWVRVVAGVGSSEGKFSTKVALGEM